MEKSIFRQLVLFSGRSDSFNGKIGCITLCTVNYLFRKWYILQEKSITSFIIRVLLFMNLFEEGREIK